MKSITKRKLTINDYHAWSTLFVPKATPEDFKELLQKIILDEEQDKSYSFLLEDEKDIVGFIQVFNVLRKPSDSGMIEVMIVKEKRSLGHGKLAIGALEEFSFKELKLQRLMAPISVDNKASLALFKSLGYEKAFTDPSAFFFRGKPMSCEMYVKLNMNPL